MERLVTSFTRSQEVAIRECLNCKTEIRCSADAANLFGGPKYCFECIEILKREEKDNKKSDKVFSCMMNFRIPHNLRANPNSNDPNEYGLVDHTLTDSQENAFRVFKEGNSVYIWGGIGSGKTYVACKCSVSGVCGGVDTLFISATKFRKSSFFSQEDDVTNYLSTPCLLIDDIGNHTVTQNVVSDILNLLSHRINEGLRTIFTSNYNPIELATRLKVGGGKTIDPVMCDAIADRILELCKVVKVSGKSFRVEKFLKEVQKD